MRARLNLGARDSGTGLTKSRQDVGDDLRWGSLCGDRGAGLVLLQRLQGLELAGEERGGHVVVAAAFEAVGDDGRLGDQVGEPD